MLDKAGSPLHKHGSTHKHKQLHGATGTIRRSTINKLSQAQPTAHSGAQFSSMVLKQRTQVLKTEKTLGPFYYNSTDENK